jgi:hypothetical protein
MNMRKLKYVKLFESFLINEGKLDPQFCQKQSDRVQGILSNLLIKAGMSSVKSLKFWKLGQSYLPSSILIDCEEELKNDKINSSMVLSQISGYSEEESKYGTQFANSINLLRAMQFIGDKSTNTLYIQFMQAPGDGMTYQDFKNEFDTSLTEEEQKSFLEAFNDGQKTNFEKLKAIYLSLDGKGRTDDKEHGSGIQKSSYFSMIR